MSDAPISSFSAAPGYDQGQQQQPQPDQQVSPDNLAEGFLKNVDPRDRPVVERYVRDWDRGVNARFREIHQQYQPYKDLGAEMSEIQTALNIARLIDSDPQYIWEALGNEFGFANQSLGNGGQPSPGSNVAGSASVPVGQNGQGGVGQPAYEGLPEPFVTEFSQMRDLLTMMAQRFIDQDKQSKEAQEDQELDSYMEALHQQYGDFDDDWVLAKMFQGTDGDQAVQGYRAFVQNIINGNSSVHRPVPPILGGGGAIPGGMNPAELSRSQAKGLLADMLAKTAQQNQ